jgi:hypothetical protein
MMIHLAPVTNMRSLQLSRGLGSTEKGKDETRRLRLLVAGGRMPGKWLAGEFLVPGVKVTLLLNPGRHLKGPNCPPPPRFPSIFALLPFIHRCFFPYLPLFSPNNHRCGSCLPIPAMAAIAEQVTPRPDRRNGVCPNGDWT